MFTSRKLVSLVRELPNESSGRGFQERFAFFNKEPTVVLPASCGTGPQQRLHECLSS